MIPDKKIEVNVIKDLFLLYRAKRNEPTAAFLENIHWTFQHHLFIKVTEAISIFAYIVLLKTF